MTTRNRLWPPNSPSFKACSFCLWIILKDKGNSNNLCTEHYLKKVFRKVSSISSAELWCAVKFVTWVCKPKETIFSLQNIILTVIHHIKTCGPPVTANWKSNYHTLASHQVKCSDVVDARFRKKNVLYMPILKTSLLFNQPSSRSEKNPSN